MKRILFLFLLISCIELPSYAQNNSFTFNHILITNDDGIEDYTRLMALAKKVKTVAKRVSIVVSDTDRSGYSNFSSLGKKTSILHVKCIARDDATHIDVYTTTGTPADCVLIGMMGLFPDDTPDLVLSGINSGTNAGIGWFQSGTIGAARMAAYLGVKAIAFSGFEDHQLEAYEKIPGWIAKFITSPAIGLINDQQYLTVAFPEISFDKYKGVKIVGRKIAYANSVQLAHFINNVTTDPHQPGTESSWTLKYLEKPKTNQSKTDIEYLQEGYVVINAMSIDENDPKLHTQLDEIKNVVPGFY